MPTAARWPCAAPSSLSSSRLGLISAMRDREQARALVMVDDDHVEPGRLGLLERLERLRAAIDADRDARAARLQLDQRLARRAIALHQPVGDVDDRLGAEPAQQQHQQRRAGRAVDVIIAEDGDRLAALDRVGEPLARPCPCPGSRTGRAGSRGSSGRGGGRGRRARRRARAAARRPARPCRAPGSAGRRQRHGWPVTDRSMSSAASHAATVSRGSARVQG